MPRLLVGLSVVGGCAAGGAPGLDTDPADVALGLARELVADEPVVLSVHTDALGTHVRLAQRHDGVPVEGVQAIVHLRGDRVTRVSGALRPDVDVATDPVLDADEAAALARRGAERVASVDLRILRFGGEDRLAWRVQLEDLDVPTRPLVWVDATTGEELWRHENLPAALDREIYDARWRAAYPGALARSEGQPSSGDAQVDDAWRAAAATWAFYDHEEGRDSWDGAGAPMAATVRYGAPFGGAFWDGWEAVLGSGDSFYRPMSGALDVVAHELTHGVVEQTANLVVASESGGVNESICDVLGDAVEARAQGWVEDDGTFLLGEDVTRPGGPDPAIRSLSDPPSVGVGIDDYASYVEGMDVHQVSGIASKAFSLAVADPSLDLRETANLWYLALVNEMTPTTDFLGARQATVTTATALYGTSSAELGAVEAAWDGVGVRDWQPLDVQTPLQAPTATNLRFQVVVPAGPDALQVRAAGDTGNADLYVRFGAPPTTTVYDCTSRGPTSKEHCELPAAAGTWYVLLVATQGYAGLTLTTSTAVPLARTLVEVCDDGLDDDLDGATDCADADCAAAAWCAPLAGAVGSDQRFTLEAPPGATQLTIALSGGTGDADLYVSGGALPTTTRADCASATAGNAESCVVDPRLARTWHVLVRGSATFDGVQRSLLAR